jgi:murein DD-endopeptidase MepM/ murein hydrolase activator NlpD
MTASGDHVVLADYYLAAPSVVILDDGRDPYVSWRNHEARTGRGGVDLVAWVGTPVFARTSGFMYWVPDDGSAGHSCRFMHRSNPGWADVFSHLSLYVGFSGQYFERGDVVAYTGDTGNVDPHLHWHVLSPEGVRQNPWNLFTDRH